MMNRMTGGAQGWQVDPTNISVADYAGFYERTRRDALFAFSLPQTDGSVILGRDHLGNVPLFYRSNAKGVQASPLFAEVLSAHDTISPEGVRAYLATGSAKILPLTNEVHSVPPGTVLRVFPDGRTETLYEYRFAPRTLQGRSFASLVDEADTLLTQAARRTLKEKEVGLYLSGGIDSALSALALRTAGAVVHAYTATPWGQESEEARLASLNAKAVGAASHEMVPLATDSYDAYAAHPVDAYGNPCGAVSQMAIRCILEGTKIKEERQVYFAQNCDTMNASVPDQSLLYFMRNVPGLLRQGLHPSLGRSTLADELTHFRSVNLVDAFPFPLRAKGYTREAELAVAGMLFAHTPVDGDIVILPSLSQGQIVANLFYDMDVVEFALGIPLMHRLTTSPESRIAIALGKRVFKELARRHLPPDIVDRKKGLTVPTGRDEKTKAFFDALPREAFGVALSLPTHRFAAEMLARWSADTPTAPEGLRNLSL